MTWRAYEPLPTGYGDDHMGQVGIVEAPAAKRLYCCLTAHANGDRAWACAQRKARELNRERMPKGGAA